MTGSRLFICLLVADVVFSLDCEMRMSTRRKVSRSSQGLKVFPAVFDANATQLDVSDNDVISVPEGVLVGVPSLRTLDARRNRIRHVSPRAFDGLICLRRVDLSHNELRQLDPLVFARNEALQTLDVSDNPLDVEDDSPLLISTSLRVLSAHGTSVKHLSGATLTRLPALEALRLDQVTDVHPMAFHGLADLLVVSLRPVCGVCCDTEAFYGLKVLRDSGRLDVILCEDSVASGKVVVAVSALVAMAVFTVAVAGPCWYLRKCRERSNHNYTGIVARVTPKYDGNKKTLRTLDVKMSSCKSCNRAPLI